MKWFFQGTLDRGLDPIPAVAMSKNFLENSSTFDEKSKKSPVPVENKPSIYSRQKCRKKITKSKVICATCHQEKLQNYCSTISQSSDSSWRKFIEKNHSKPRRKKSCFVYKFRGFNSSDLSRVERFYYPKEVFFTNKKCKSRYLCHRRKIKLKQQNSFINYKKCTTCQKIKHIRINNSNFVG